MCWTAAASITATTIGAAATLYAVKKDVPKERTFALGFFTLMELLQAISYASIGQCDMSHNKTLTYLSFTHITLQMPVINAFMLSYISDKKRKRWYKPVMALSLLGSLFMLFKMLVPTLWDVPKEWMCRVGDALCGEKSCSYMGTWHLAWRLPLLGFDPSFLIYFGLVFFMPILYGSWRISVFHFLVGPFLSSFLSSDHNEIPAIWCLFSIAILIAIFFGPLKRWFETPMRKA